MGERTQGIHARWCTKQPLMDQTNEGLTIPDDVQSNWWWTKQMKNSMPDDAGNNLWSMRPMKNYPYQKMCKTTVDGWYRIRNSYQMMYETAVDGWDQRTATHTRSCIERLLMDEKEAGIHTRWCRNYCWWIRKMKDYSYQMVYKTTADGWER